MRGRANATPTSESAVAITDSATTFQRAPRAFARRTPRSLVVLAPGSRAPIRISGSAADVWDMLVDPRSASDLVTEAVRRVGGSPEMLASEVDAALDLLVAAGAVVSA